MFIVYTWTKCTEEYNDAKLNSFTLSSARISVTSDICLLQAGEKISSILVDFSSYKEMFNWHPLKPVSNKKYYFVLLVNNFGTILYE